MFIWFFTRILSVELTEGRLWGQIEWRFGLSSLEHQLREAGVDQWPLHEETDFVGASSSIARFKGEAQVGTREECIHEECIHE